LCIGITWLYCRKPAVSHPEFPDGNEITKTPRFPDREAGRLRLVRLENV
jgi:hypothetical protein